MELLNVLRERVTAAERHVVPTLVVATAELRSLITRLDELTNIVEGNTEHDNTE